MANHYKNNSGKKPARANGKRYRETPKGESKLRKGLSDAAEGLRGFKNTLPKSVDKKPSDKKYTARRYKDQDKPEIFRLNGEKAKSESRYRRGEIENVKKEKVVSLRRKNGEEKQPNILWFRRDRAKGAEDEKNAGTWGGKGKPINPEDLPTPEQLEDELKRERSKKDNNRLVRNTVFALITVAAIAVLVATLFLPILQIYGTSMSPTLSEGEIVVSVKGATFERGDIISFYYNNKILVKRAIAFEGEYVNIDNEGKVYVNNRLIDEPYLTERSLGECDIKLPYQVPAGKIFVLGDHRSISVDSRSSVLGCVSEEQIVGKIAFRLWPVNRLGEIR